jgi:hypothetical protein
MSIPNVCHSNPRFVMFRSLRDAYNDSRPSPQAAATPDEPLMTAVWILFLILGPFPPNKSVREQAGMSSDRTQNPMSSGQTCTLLLIGDILWMSAYEMTCTCQETDGGYTSPTCLGLDTWEVLRFGLHSKAASYRHG